MDSLKKAYIFASKAHAGQRRKRNKAPYISHCLKVHNTVSIACTLAEMPTEHALNIKMAALLHDVVEDTHYTCPHLEREFNGLVAYFVDLLTRYKKETKEEAIKKACTHIPSCIIKLADRIDNITDLLAEGEIRKEYMESTLLLLTESKRHEECPSVFHLRNHLNTLVHLYGSR